VAIADGLVRIVGIVGIIVVVVAAASDIGAALTAGISLVLSAIDAAESCCVLEPEADVFEAGVTAEKHSPRGAQDLAHLGRITVNNAFCTGPRRRRKSRRYLEAEAQKLSLLILANIECRKDTRLNVCELRKAAWAILQVTRLRRHVAAAAHVCCDFLSLSLFFFLCSLEMMM
jgi:hypothetical protein